MLDDKFRKVAGVPHIDSSIPPNISRVLQALKLNWELALAHARETGGGLFGTPADALPLPPVLDDFTDTDVPPKPLNVRATGGFAVITLDWDVPRYRNHSHAEIWRAEADDLTAAKIIGQTPGSVFSDPVGNNRSYWYWVRFVSLANVVGPYHDAAGLYAKTALDPEYALKVLEGQIAESQLHRDLASRISSSSEAVIQQASQISGLKAQYTVKIDSNGYVTGYGLASEPVNGAPYSTFAVRADRFYIASPSGPGVAATMPFIVQTTPTTAGDGSVIPAGVYLRDAFIANGTIKRAQIGLGAIDEARIADAAITRAKIADASIDSAKIANIIQSNNYGATSGWLINRDGSAYFNNLFARGTFQSSNYSPGAAGWRITNAGDAEFNSLKIRVPAKDVTGDIHALISIPNIVPGGRFFSINASDTNWRDIHTLTVPAPSRSTGHRIAANVSMCAGSLDGYDGIQDVELRILIAGTEVAWVAHTSIWNLSLTALGATTGRYGSAVTVQVQARCGYTGLFTIRRISGVVWTID